MLTVPGEGFCARMGAGFNATAGLQAFTASNAAEIISIAFEWAANFDALAEFRSGLRDRVAQTALFDCAQFIFGFEAALSGLR